MKIRKAVIPCAGFGTRFLPITKIVPKELLPIGDKPAIHYVVEEAVAAGIEEIILVCNRQKISIVDYFRPDTALIRFLEKRGKSAEIQRLAEIESLADFTVVYQEEALGLGDAVLCTREAVGQESFLVMLPDVLILQEIPASRQLIESCGGSWGIILERVPKERISSYGVIRGEEISSGLYRIQGAVEKPVAGEAPSDLGILGRYLFTPDIFEEIGRCREGVLGEIQLTDAIDSLARRQNGLGVVCREKVFDVGTPQGLAAALSGLVGDEFGQGRGGGEPGRLDP